MVAAQSSPTPLRPAVVSENDNAHNVEKEPENEQDNRREPTEDDCKNQLGYGFSNQKKWWILIVIFLMQTSMSFNTTLL
jgi:hypothetical protein